MFHEMIRSWWFWVAGAGYILFWVFTIGFWQGRKEGSKRIKTFVQEYYLMHKYPFRNDFGYDIMSILGPPAFLFYLLVVILRYVVPCILVVLAAIFFLIFEIGLIICSLGSKAGSK